MEIKDNDPMYELSSEAFHLNVINQTDEKLQSLVTDATTLYHLSDVELEQKFATVETVESQLIKLIRYIGHSMQPEPGEEIGSADNIRNIITHILGLPEVSKFVTSGWDGLDPSIWEI